MQRFSRKCGGCRGSGYPVFVKKKKAAARKGEVRGGPKVCFMGQKRERGPVTVRRYAPRHALSQREERGGRALSIGLPGHSASIQAGRKLQISCPLVCADARPSPMTDLTYPT